LADILTIKGLALGYGGEPVLDGVDLSVGAGRIVALVGPSGSGKSSILRTVMELQAPLAGRITLGVHRAEIGILFQDDALLPWRTVRDNVALGLRARGWGLRRRTDEAEAWLRRVGLSGLGERYPARLSGGQRKRAALAQVLVLKPRFLLMDEPFSALDAIVRHRISQDLLGLVEREGIAVLLVTHDLEEALALSDETYLLSAGPRAHISQRYDVPLGRPRDIDTARADPRFGPLATRLWQDLSAAVGPAVQ
jgi:NitT/TauT family transport system ATP-binding protein